MDFQQVCHSTFKSIWCDRLLDVKMPKSCDRLTRLNMTLYYQHRHIIRWKQKFAKVCFLQVKSMALQATKRQPPKVSWLGLTQPGKFRENHQLFFEEIRPISVFS